MLARIVQPEDIPALRARLLAGTTCVAQGLGRLQGVGVDAAGDALIEGVRAGRFDARLAAALPGGNLNGVEVGRLYVTHEAALGGASYRDRASKAVRAWVSRPAREVGDEARRLVASALGGLEARDDAPLLERWIASTRDRATRLELGRVLTRLGSRAGVALLVEVAAGRVPGPPTPGSGDPGAPRADRYESWQRQAAVEHLNDLVVGAAPGAARDVRARRTRGPWGRWYHEDEFDAVGAKVRAWWEASRDRLRFDPKTGRWKFAWQ